jgi:hypothetical protein
MKYHTLSTTHETDTGLRFSEALNLFSKWASTLLELQSCRQQQQEEEDLGVVATPGNGNLFLSLSLPLSLCLCPSLL